MDILNLLRNTGTPCGITHPLQVGIIRIVGPGRWGWVHENLLIRKEDAPLVLFAEQELMPWAVGPHVWSLTPSGERIREAAFLGATIVWEPQGVVKLSWLAPLRYTKSFLLGNVTCPWVRKTLRPSVQDHADLHASFIHPNGDFGCEQKTRAL